MGHIYADIELANLTDIILHRQGKVEKEEIRILKVECLVDTGASKLSINPVIKRQLGLEVLRMRVVELADGSTQEVEIVGPIELKFKTRSITTDAMVFDNPNATVLLGAIPLQDMDVIIDPFKETLELPRDRQFMARIRA